MEGVRKEIEEYIRGTIIPCYDGFDRGHGRSHAEYVIDTAMRLSDFYDVDREMVAVAAACHDLGLCEDRRNHHLVSGRMVRADARLRKWFSEEQIETIAQAAEDHRASSDHAPRTIYGRIIAESDRQIIPEVVIRRAIQYGIDNYPELDRESHWRRMVEHLGEKYAEGGYLKLWIPESPNAARLAELRSIMRDESGLRAIFDRIFDKESTE